jgi:hypothetical protein
MFTLDRLYEGTDSPQSGTLVYHRELTTALRYNASGTEVRDALRNLQVIGNVGVSREGPDVNQGFTWIITFFTERGDLPLLSVDKSSLLGSSTVINVVEGYERKDYSTHRTNRQACKGSIPTIQTVTTFASSTLRGKFKLGFRDIYTSDIPHDASADTMKFALQDISTIGDVKVSRNGPNGIGSYDWVITFIENSGKLQKLVGQVTTLSGQTTDDGRIDVNIIQNGTAPQLSGTFKLSFRGETTSDIIWNATDQEVKTKLENLHSVETVQVSRSLKDHNGGFIWLVTFLTEKDDIPMLKMDGLSLLGANCPYNIIDNKPITGIKEVKRGRFLSGNFTLELAGLRTSTISFDATAITVETSLQQLSPKFENVTVSRSGLTSEGGYHWTVTFNNIVGNLLVMEADFTRLEGWDSKIIVVQRDAGSEKLRGSFKLQFSNHVTSSVPFNANAIALKKAIEDLPNV